MLAFNYWRKYQKCMKDTKSDYGKCKEKYFKYRKVTRTYTIKDHSRR